MDNKTIFCWFVYYIISIDIIIFTAYIFKDIPLGYNSLSSSIIRLGIPSWLMDILFLFTFDKELFKKVWRLKISRLIWMIISSYFFFFFFLAMFFKNFIFPPLL
jgi:hypothetical protein